MPPEDKHLGKEDYGLEEAINMLSGNLGDLRKGGSPAHVRVLLAIAGLLESHIRWTRARDFLHFGGLVQAKYPPEPKGASADPSGRIHSATIRDQRSSHHIGSPVQDDLENLGQPEIGSAKDAASECARIRHNLRQIVNDAAMTLGKIEGIIHRLSRSTYTWHPVSEEPKQEGRYIVATNGRRVTLGTWFRDTRLWAHYLAHPLEDGLDVTHWAELPKPPEEGR